MVQRIRSVYRNASRLIPKNVRIENTIRVCAAKTFFLSRSVTRALFRRKPRNVEGGACGSAPCGRGPGPRERGHALIIQPGSFPASLLRVAQPAAELGTLEVQERVDQRRWLFSISLNTQDQAGWRRSVRSEHEEGENLSMSWLRQAVMWKQSGVLSSAVLDAGVFTGVSL